jgi:osmotically-inducible protein OsmY
VKTLFAQVQAERLAHSVNGVVAVQNHLRLVPR